MRGFSSSRNSLPNGVDLSNSVENEFYCLKLLAAFGLPTAQAQIKTFGKNFSVFLGPGGSFRLAPLYDVLTAQPSADARHIERKQLKLAMSVGNSRHYRLDEIQGRHFIQSTERAGLPRTLAEAALQEVGDAASKALDQLAGELPAGFPKAIHASVKSAITSRLEGM